MPAWIGYAFLSALFAALTAILAKQGLKNVDPDVATAVRTVVILVISWGIVIFRGKSGAVSDFSWSNWTYLVLSGLATGLSWLFYYRALQQGNTSVVSAIDKGSLVLVVIMAWLFLEEPFTARLAIGAALMLAGMLVLVYK